VIGTAFATVVKTVVDNLVSPLIASIGGANVN
jgi:large conductance mechanosensitive channel